MTSDPRAFFAVDEGTATHSAALIARAAGRWRLAASVAFPAAIGTDAILGLLVERVAAAAPELGAAIGADRSATERWTRVTARSRPAGRLAVLAASERTLVPLVAAVRGAGRALVSGSVERLDPLAMTAVLLDPGVDLAVVGAGEPPSADERAGLDDLAALVAAAAVRRPDLVVVLCGSMAERAASFEALAAGPDAGAPARVVLGPAADAGEPPGSTLRSFVASLVSRPEDARQAIARAAGSLAEAIDRRIEVVEIGASGGLRVQAAPTTTGEPARVATAAVASAALAGDEADDAVVDGVLLWSTVAIDRHRLRDRLRELRIAPWGDPAGDGALLRMAAARAALGRLVDATPHLHAAPVPDVVVAAGGVWAGAPGSAVALALADVLRRPGATQLAHDHARLLGPLGTIDDPDERRSVLRDLAGDLLAPLGSVVIPQGMRAGRTAGRLVVHAATGSRTEVELVPGGLELVDLPPGETAVAEFEFRDQVRLGTRGRQFAVTVGGGLGGLLVDLRDVPLRLPDRHDRRRELLGAWQAALWAGVTA